MRSKTNPSWLVRLRALALAACLPLLGASYWPTTNDAEVAKGQEAYSAGDYEAAVSAFARATRGKGDRDRLQFDLGTALLQSAMVADDEAHRAIQLERSIAALRSASDSKEADLRERALFNLGNALALRRRYDEAVAMYRQLLVANPAHDDARHNLRFVLARRDQETDESAAQKGQPGAQDPEGQGEGQAGQEPGQGTDKETDGQQESQGGQGQESVEAGPRETQGSGQGAESALPSESRVQAETINLGANPGPERGPDNLTVVQKLDALERRSGELRRGNLLQKSRSRLRHPNQEGTEQ